MWYFFEGGKWFGGGNCGSNPILHATKEYLKAFSIIDGISL